MASQVTRSVSPSFANFQKRNLPGNIMESKMNTSLFQYKTSSGKNQNEDANLKDLKRNKVDTTLPSLGSKRNNYHHQIVWRNVLWYGLLHIYSAYGLICITFCSLKTILFSYLLYSLGTLGVTMGAHRLWSHKAIKANLTVRIFLAFCQTLAFQNDIYRWARDHRAHHKFSETDADPHNANRGFFFAHMGWLMCRKHPDVIRKGRTLDLSDVLFDPVIIFQRKYYTPLVILVCFVLPTLIPWYFWNENLLMSLIIAGFLRYCLSLHATWLVNSLAHWIGSKPYDKFISPTENHFVSLLTFGEGWHNYHHTFPQDYRTGELGGLLNFNVTTLIINFCKKRRWVWNCKTVSENVLRNRKARTGES